MSDFIQKDVAKTDTLSDKKIIKLASHAGFCYGVKRAVETTKKLKEENPERDIYVLGELIHNSQVIKDLESMGILTVENLPENKSGNEPICVIRSHGASFEVFDDIKNKGYELVDLTCPDVKKVQNKAIALAKEGYFLIILGEPKHPEVSAIEANAKRAALGAENVYVAKNIKALEKIADLIKKQEKVGVVVQTTQRIEHLNEMLEYLLPISKELRVVNTICASTSLRQNEARELAKESDLMIVVGSKKSANTTHLAEILMQVSETIHIETDEELEEYKGLIKKAQSIGVTAGASTPDYIINKVLYKLKGDN